VAVIQQQQQPPEKETCEAVADKQAPMAGLAIVMLGAMTGAAGFVVGLVPATVAVLLGPHGINLVPRWMSAVALSALGCAGWACTWSQIDIEASSRPGDFSQLLDQACILGAVSGYAAACAVVLGASLLWDSADADVRDYGKFLLAIAVVILCILFGSA
jgi:hypothetical protein